jgi:DNA-binding NtrC family response regulator
MAEIAAGRFREDLFYRLNVLHIHVSPLRERREDIPALLAHYLDHYCARHGVGARSFSEAALDALTTFDWPGNVRQLKNVVERLVVKTTRPTIDVADLPRDLHLPRTAIAVEGTARAGVVDRSVVSELLARMLEGRQSFWAVAYAPFMSRDLTRAQLTDIVASGLERTAGNYRSLVTLFNMPPSDYKRFLTFLTSHRCHVPFQAYRSAVPSMRRPAPLRALESPAAHAVGM